MPNRNRIAAVLLGLAALQTTACAETILFVGNSFTFGGDSPPVQEFQPETVTDLNREGMGGVPALFKAFTREAGLAYDVSLETASGMNLDFHHEQKSALIAARMGPRGRAGLQHARCGRARRCQQDHRLLGAARAVCSTRRIRKSTCAWSRPGRAPTRPISNPATGSESPSKPWRSTCAPRTTEAAAHSSYIRAVIPVGQAWNRAIAEGIAARNPYQGVGADQINLWAADGYHASVYGYYLEALVIFGSVTGHDPRSLGRQGAGGGAIGDFPGHGARAAAHCFRNAGERTKT